MNGSACLQVTNLVAGYDDVEVLSGVSLELKPGEVVALVGANGAGKSTLLKCIAGLIKPWSGSVVADGAAVASTIGAVSKGLILVPEGRLLFPGMSVAENLLMGAYHRQRKEYEQTLAWIYELFPVLAARQKQLAGTLSGGEQQMCALGRGLMADPKVLMIDELSLGLAPMVVDQLLEVISLLPRQGLSILLVEQNVAVALEVAQRGYVLEKGRIVLAGAAQELLQTEEIRVAYLGL